MTAHRRPIATITTIEGTRHVTLGDLSPEEYAKQRAALVSADTRVGKTRVSA